MDQGTQILGFFEMEEFFNLFGADTSKPPLFETKNDAGEPVKWWKSKTLTDWAQQPDSHGVVLPDVYGWVVEDKLGWSYVLTESNRAIFSSTKLEDCAVQIDIMKLVKSGDQK